MSAWTGPGRSADDFTFGNQIAALTLHGSFSHVGQTRHFYHNLYSV